MKKKESGLTLISWIIMLGMIAFFATLAIRLAPVYLEYYAVSKVMEGMKVEIRNKKLSEKEVRRLITKRLQVSNVKNVDNKDIKLSRGRNSRAIKSVDIDYDVEVPFIAQLNLIGRFHQNIGGELER